MKRFFQWQLTPSAFYRLLMAMMLVLVSALLCRAQEPAAAEPDVAVAQTESAGPQPTESAGLLTETIAEQAPRQPAELLNAVLQLRQARAYGDAAKYLDQLIAQQLNDQQLSELHRQTGTGTLFQLANDQNLPAAREFVHRIFAAVRAGQNNVANKLLSELASAGDDEQRRVAASRLAAKGALAVVALIDAVGRPNGITPENLNLVLERLPGEAEPALLAALAGPDEVIQGMAARGLGMVGGDSAAVPLLRPFFVSPHFVQREATAALKRLHNQLPTDVNSAARTVRQQHKSYMQRARSAKGAREMWTWDAQRRNVVAVRMGEREAAAVLAARRAKDLSQLAPSAENNLLLLIAMLQSDQLLSGTDQALRRGPGTAHQLGQSLGSDVVGQALKRSLQTKCDSAAIGALQLWSELNANQIPTAEQWRLLVQAAQSPNRQVRFAAVRAVMEIDPRQAYPGSSYVLESLIELASASGRPQALVATPRRDAGQLVAGQLGTLGFDVQLVSEGRPFLQAALKRSDLDIAVVSDSFSRPTTYQTLQQFRKTGRLKGVPVIVLGRDGQWEKTQQLARLDGLAVALPEFADIDDLEAELMAAEQMVTATHVAATQRAQQARQCLQWLAHLAEYSQTYKFYDLMRAELAAVHAAGRSEMQQDAVRLLGFLGGSASQATLVDLASQVTPASGDDRLRKAAANAFGEAVLRRGLMLRAGAVKRQYARYNASETADAATQEVLGQVLDVIETQTQPKAAAE